MSHLLTACQIQYLAVDITRLGGAEKRAGVAEFGGATEPARRICGPALGQNVAKWPAGLFRRVTERPALQNQPKCASVRLSWESGASAG